MGEHMLYITNHDVPGVIGSIGQTTHQCNINIANLHLGRAKSGGDAIALLEIDAPPEQSALEQLRAQPDIYGVTYLSFPA